jgi:hypothetical protein
MYIYIDNINLTNTNLKLDKNKNTKIQKCKTIKNSLNY